MKRFLSIVLPLLAIAGAAGILTGLTYRLLEKKINHTARMAETEILTGLIPDADSFTNMFFQGHSYFVALDGRGNVAGKIYQLEQPGYGGPVAVWTAVTDGAVSRVRVLSVDRETPGIGMKALDEKWLSRFAGMTEANVDGMDSVTGATLTSRAVVRCVKEALRYDAYLLKGPLTNAGINGLDISSGASKRNGY